MIEQRINQILTAGFTGQAGVFYGVAPLDTQPPYLVVNNIFDNFNTTLAGQCAGVVTSIQIDSYAKAPSQAKLNGRTAAELLAEIAYDSLTATPSYDSDRKLYRYMVEFNVLLED